VGIYICEFLAWFCLGFGILHGWNRKELLYRMLWMMFFSLIIVFLT
jgi:hypothetical protein